MSENEHVWSVGYPPDPESSLLERYIIAVQAREDGSYQEWGIGSFHIALWDNTRQQFKVRVFDDVWWYGLGDVVCWRRFAGDEVPTDADLLHAVVSRLVDVANGNSQVDPCMHMMVIQDGLQHALTLSKRMRRRRESN